MWLHNDLATLWTMAKNRASCNAAFKDVSIQENRNWLVNSAVSLGRSGMMGKAGHMLLSSGIMKQLRTCCRPSIQLAPGQWFLSHLQTLCLLARTLIYILPILRSFPKGTSAGPSGLSVRHLLDAASVSLPTPICSSLKGVVNLLASGKASSTVSVFLAGGRLIALNKNKNSSRPDIRPIAVGETLRIGWWANAFVPS